MKKSNKSRIGTFCYSRKHIGGTLSKENLLNKLSELITLCTTHNITIDEQYTISDKKYNFWLNRHNGISIQNNKDWHDKLNTALGVTKDKQIYIGSDLKKTLPDDWVPLLSHGLLHVGAKIKLSILLTKLTNTAEYTKKYGLKHAAEVLEKDTVGGDKTIGMGVAQTLIKEEIQKVQENEQQIIDGIRDAIQLIDDNKVDDLRSAFKEALKGVKLHGKMQDLFVTDTNEKLFNTIELFMGNLLNDTYQNVWQSGRFGIGTLDAFKYLNQHIQSKHNARSRSKRRSHSKRRSRSKHRDRSGSSSKSGSGSGSIEAITHFLFGKQQQQ